MKRDVIRILVGLMMLLVVVGAIVVARNHRDSDYQYPNTESMSAKQILNVCRISPEKLKKMSDEALAQAVAEFPLLMDVYVTSSIEEGVKGLAKESDAYAELLKRKSGKDVLIEKTKELYESGDSETYLKACLLKDIVLHEKSFQESLTEEERAYLESIH
ncbi:MAG: hypothetical protein IJV50_07750 [Lachnospiraceae bacterium]|nr:hypothetical protein [Lachnospiraceae bacterium]